MKLRLANKQDEEFIKLIYKDCKKEIGSFNLYNCWDDYLKNKTPYKFYVLDEIGMMRYGFSKKLNSFTIKDIGILKLHQGKGYGNIFFKNTCSPLYLTCNFDNINGNKFYEKMGMKKIGQKTSKNKKQVMNIWIM
jgi:hypothetical protein